MIFKDLSRIFNRSLHHSFGIKKNLYLFLTLVCSGLIYLFFQALASYAPFWLKFPLRSIPIFIIIGCVMAAGIFLIQLYIQERNGKSLDGLKIAWNHWDLILKAAYLALPLLLVFLIFWIVIGIFMLLKMIPYLGTLLGIILAFFTFLLNFGISLLFLAALFTFFFVVPSLVQIEHLDRKGMFQQMREDFFTHFLLLSVACFPVWIIWKLVEHAAEMTLQLYAFEGKPIAIILQSGFMMLPFIAILTPSVTFFFNFAYESYLIFCQKEKSTHYFPS